MPELRNNCFMYDELLLDFAVTLGCPRYDIFCYCKGQPYNPNQYKSLFSLALAYPYSLMCKALLFACKCLRTSVRKTSMVWPRCWHFANNLYMAPSYYTYTHPAVDLCKYLNNKTSCAVDVFQYRIMRRIYQTGINLLLFDSTVQCHYKAPPPIGKGTLSVFRQLHPLDRLVHILTYHAVGYVVEWW